jgi:hypothetical protein
MVGGPISQRHGIIFGYRLKILGTTMRFDTYCFAVLVAILATNVNGQPAGRAKCLEYEPAHVSISGKLVRLTFPGRPNYESIAQGDEPETYFYMQPTVPICVAASKDDDVDDAKDGVRLVQLILDDAGYKRLRKSIGHVISVSGTLEGAITGHHHAPLLLNVIKRDNAP